MRHGRLEDTAITRRMAHDHEVDGMSRQWAAGVDAETRSVDAFGPFVQVGPKRGHGMRLRMLHRAVKLEAAEMLRACDLLVAGADGVVLGWCALDLPTREHPLTLHFVHVEDLVRRRGIGRLLIRSALTLRDTRAPRYTCITTSGASLLRAVAALSDSTEVHAREAASGVVEARGL